MDFPLSISALDLLGEAVGSLARDLPPPVATPVAAGGFRWEYPLCSVEVVQIAKAVRMVTSIRSAWFLAEAGHTTESATLLRIASDTASEIDFLSEGTLAGAFNTAQQKFIEDFFKPLPIDPDELAEMARERYVSRKEIIAAKTRMAQRAGLDGERLRRLIGALNKGYDAYVHAAYPTAMELFDGSIKSFMLDGNRSPRGLCVAKTIVAGKLHEVLAALELMAFTRKNFALAGKLEERRLALHASREPKGVDCPN